MHKPIKIPFGGSMNLDDPEEVLPPSMHSGARNIIFSGNKGDMRADNFPGTRLIPTELLPDGTNVCIGGIYDSVKNRIFYAISNSNGDHAWFIEDVKTEVISVLINDGAVLDFDPVKPISSISIFYGGDITGDALFWVNSQGIPCRISIDQAIASSYGIYRDSYLKLIKEPSDIHPSCVYEDDSTVTVNQVKKELFKFKIWFEYELFDKSVTSEQSVVPMPLPVDENDPDQTKSSRISLVFQTGAPNVKKIHVAVAKNLGVTFSDFYEIDVLDKATLSIPDDDLYIYRFYNDKVFINVPVPFSILDFDRIPLKVNAMELLNGNTPGVSGVTEGYDILKTLGATDNSVTLTYNQRTQPKALMVVAQGGKTMGVAGTNIHIIVLGTITTGDIFTVYTTSQTITFTVGATQTIAAVLAGLSAAAVTAGFTVVSTDANNLYINKAAEQLTRYRVAPATAYLEDNDVTPVYDWWSRYSFAPVYFDAEGRSPGAMISKALDVQTPGYTEIVSGEADIPIITLNFWHQPPVWAKTMKLARTKNLSKTRILQWISDRTFKDDIPSADGNLYSWISIESLNQFIQDHSSSKFLAYDFTPGDRIRFIKLYPLGDYTTPVIYSTKDFEIQGQEINPMVNGLQLQGQFVKIYTPTISDTFDFGTQATISLGTVNFSNYFFEIYTPAKAITEDLNNYYEFGESYAIGDAGLSTRYHQGSVINQLPDYSGAAIYNLTQGDFYLRKRVINAAAELKYTIQDKASLGGGDFIPMALAQTYVSSGYTAQSVPAAHLTGNLYLSAFWAIDITDGGAYSFKFEGDIVMQANTGDGTTGFTIRAYATKPDGSSVIDIILGTGEYVLAGNTYSLVISSVFDIPVGYTKVFVMFVTPDIDLFVHLISGNLTIKESDKLFNQICVDNNYSDTFQSAVNSNGRAWVFDPNAKQSNFPVLMRYGLPFQPDTNINESNRFYPQNTDTFNAAYGPVMRMKQHGKTCRVYQYRKCGEIGIFNRWIKNADGGNQLITTDTIITPNNIYYYDGNNGIGNQVMSLVTSGTADYFADPVMGQLIRVSLDGLNSISELYKAQTWTTGLFPEYLKNLPYEFGGYAKILGTFNRNKDGTGDYYCFAQKGASGDAFVGGDGISFNERDNAFRSMWDINPDFVMSIENKLYAWKGGQLYVFDKEDSCGTFFGTAHNAEIEIVTGEPRDMTKEYMTISFNQPSPIYNVSVPIWIAPSIGDVKTSTGLVSNIITQDFDDNGYKDGMYHAPIRRAWTAESGTVEGDEMKGIWLRLRLKNSSLTKTFLSSLYINIINSPKNF